MCHSNVGTWFHMCDLYDLGEVAVELCGWRYVLVRVYRKLSPRSEVGARTWELQLSADSLR